jgi:hypothetical protein
MVKALHVPIGPITISHRMGRTFRYGNFIYRRAEYQWVEGKNLPIGRVIFRVVKSSSFLQHETKRPRVKCAIQTASLLKCQSASKRSETQLAPLLLGPHKVLLVTFGSYPYVQVLMYLSPTSFFFISKSQVPFLSLSLPPTVFFSFISLSLSTFSPAL